MTKTYNIFIYFFSFFSCMNFVAAPCCTQNQLLGILKIYRSDMLQEQEDFYDKQEEELYDKLDEIVANLYQNIVKITALYYFQNLHGQHDINHSLLSELGTDVKKLIKLLTLYVPKLLQNNNMSWREKIKKLSSAFIVLSVIAMWTKQYLQKPMGVFHGTDVRNSLFIPLQDMKT